MTQIFFTLMFTMSVELCSAQEDREALKVCIKCDVPTAKAFQYENVLDSTHIKRMDFCMA